MLAQASSGKTGYLEGSSNDKLIDDLASTITSVVLKSVFSKDSLTELENLTNNITSVLLESALSEASMQDSQAAQDESDRSALPEETVSPPSNPPKEITPADRELLFLVYDALEAYASKHNLGLEITIGQQPTKDLTISTPELFNSLGVVLLTYVQTHTGWGTCTVDDSCTHTWRVQES